VLKMQTTMWNYRKNMNKQILSDFMKIQMFGRFNEMDSGASKNLPFSCNPQSPSKNVEVPEQKSIIKEESQESTPRQQVRSSKALDLHLGGAGIPGVPAKEEAPSLKPRPSRRPPANLFINQLKHKANSYKNPYFKHYQSQQMTEMKISFKQTKNNQNYVDTVINNHNILVNKIKKDRKIRETIVYANIWIRNTILHPVELNREYNCMDKYQTLRILPEILDNLEKFETADKSDSTSNNIPKNMVNVFSPIQKSPNAQQQHNSSQSSFTCERIGRQKVLIVEDCEFIIKGIQSLLNKYMVDYEVAMDGEQAYQMLESYLKEGKMFDFVLMDLYMPKCDGYSSTEKMRELEIKYKINPTERHFICGHSSFSSRCKFPRPFIINFMLFLHRC
jgi:CheY-like chemotaxis protein